MPSYVFRWTVVDECFYKPIKKKKISKILQDAKWDNYTEMIDVILRKRALSSVNDRKRQQSFVRYYIRDQAFAGIVKRNLMTQFETFCRCMGTPIISWSEILPQERKEFPLIHEFSRSIFVLICFSMKIWSPQTQGFWFVACAVFIP